MEAAPSHRSTLTWSWALIVLTSLFDVWFFVRYLSTADTWESNPVPLYLVKHYGPWAPIALRLLTLSVGAWLVLLSARRVMWTGLVLAAHLYLAGLYGYIFLTTEF